MADHHRPGDRSARLLRHRHAHPKAPGPMPFHEPTAATERALLLFAQRQRSGRTRSIPRGD